MKTFEDLEVYRKSFNFSVEVFKLTSTNKINRNIANQLERAVLSISNNIAEGFELQSNRQFVKFLYISKGSCGESRNILALAHKLHQVSDETYERLKKEAIDISKQLSNFIKYLEKSEIR